ncbi:MAG: recombinase family protein [Monoglobales bacterium]
MLIGYARVSTVNQNEDRQLIDLMQYGVRVKNIYIDKQSGKDFKRPEYMRMFKRLKRDDVLVIKSIDRLGRDYTEILDEWKLITHKKGADIVVLDMPMLDTTQSKDLLGTFIADLVLQLLSFVAENERINIRQRQAEGIAAAKKRGVKFGRPRTQIPDNYAENYELWKKKKVTAQQAADNCGLPIWTFYRIGKTFK